MNQYEHIQSEYIMYFAAGALAVVIMAGFFIGISHVRWAKNNKNREYSLAQKQLHFAAATLTGLGLIFVISMAMHLWGGTKGKDVFEACKTIIPPIITLILGFYFGKEKGQATDAEKISKSTNNRGSENGNAAAGDGNRAG